MAIGEIAIALVLLMAGGLLIKSVARLQATQLGFNPAGLTAVRVALPGPQYTRSGRRSFSNDWLDGWRTA